LTILDWVVLALLGLLVAGLWGILLEQLYWGDKRGTREAQCPPHEWAPYYGDKEEGPGYTFIGLRCGKCKRTPEGLANGESWTGMFGGGLP
jgi:hypothetical protein